MTKRTYDVAITETLRKIVTVEAASKEEAYDMASRAWKNADYILDAEDFNGVVFDVVDETEQEPIVAVTTVCYGEMRKWTSREAAEDYFMQAMASSDPASSECSRYTKIYTEIITGKRICTDEED